MANRVYYGEYTLYHWVELILKQDIVLPPYQRLFVWNEEKVKELIMSFKDDKFVPPITIGARYIEDKDTVQNIIIDGQQRLTSILLAFFKIFPNKENFGVNEEPIVSENDDESDNEEDRNEIIDWKFDVLLNYGQTKDEITKKLDEKLYKKGIGSDWGVIVDESFLKTHYLGFSYLVPEKSDTKSQQNYFSSVFRNINIQAEPLSLQESREALYYLDENLEQYFKPNCCQGITVKNRKVDFLRSLAIVSQFKKRKNSQLVAKGCRNKMEKYYEIFIHDNIENKKDSLFELLNNEFKANIVNKLGDSINVLAIKKNYSSIIDFDVMFFGLIFFIIFENKTIKSSEKDELLRKLAEQISTFKSDPSHSKTPSGLTHLRNRLMQSIEIYRNFVE
jgi:uncharacterized protein with ParB-like and HNH nuclease domain